eukprot:CAMPEP_0114560034 /NCGR_PEP_ID=MMETSP0114-20121206/11240_1 /TAXON_ID=31324 /ORGANISM="Goniomonas sp, Strain m" /LENGTH=258 /DNA_ID=CAMNT_0001745545 /DNA_START=1 /DNA_END=777 /DNA_ORIENTATION=-
MQAPFLCRFFSEGKCAKGTECRFSHQASAPAAPPRPCRFFAVGSCTRGSNCSFSHEPVTFASPMGELPCRYFAQNSCTKGAQCRFSHSVGAGGAVRAPVDPLQRQAAQLQRDMAGKSEAQTKTMIGEALYVLIKERNEQLAPKLTGMLLELPPADLIGLVANGASLDEKLYDATVALEAYGEKDKEDVPAIMERLKGNEVVKATGEHATRVQHRLIVAGAKAARELLDGDKAALEAKVQSILAQLGVKPKAAAAEKKA